MHENTETECEKHGVIESEIVCFKIQSRGKQICKQNGEYNIHDSDVAYAVTMDTLSWRTEHVSVLTK